MKPRYKLVTTMRRDNHIIRIWRDEMLNSTYVFERDLDADGNVIQLL